VSVSVALAITVSSYAGAHTVGVAGQTMLTLADSPTGSSSSTRIVLSGDRRIWPEASWIVWALGSCFLVKWDFLSRLVCPHLPARFDWHNRRQQGPYVILVAAHFLG
jgi:hypothetical protein